MREREFFQNGLTIQNRYFNEFTATVTGVDREKNELFVTCISNDTTRNRVPWNETWNLQHTENGCRFGGDYDWDRSNCSNECRGCHDEIKGSGIRGLCKTCAEDTYID